MRDSMERYGNLHPRHDGERGWRELRRQLVDTGPEPGNQQWRGWQRSTLDRDGRLFELHDRGQRSDWIGGLRHNFL
jgi:hypothetical protein